MNALLKLTTKYCCYYLKLHSSTQQKSQKLLYVWKNLRLKSQEALDENIAADASSFFSEFDWYYGEKRGEFHE